MNPRRMSNLGTNFSVKFYYDRLRIDKALWNFQKFDNDKNNKKKKNRNYVRIVRHSNAQSRQCDIIVSPIYPHCRPIGC